MVWVSMSSRYLLMKETERMIHEICGNEKITVINDYIYIPSAVLLVVGSNVGKGVGA